MKAAEMEQTAFVVDVDNLDSPGAEGTKGEALKRASAKLKSWGLQSAHALRSLGTYIRKGLFNKAPIEVGKRKLLREQKDTCILVAPLVLWFILVLALFSSSTSLASQMQRPLINNYLADRLVAKTANTIADVHIAVSQVLISSHLIFALSLPCI